MQECNFTYNDEKKNIEIKADEKNKVEEKKKDDAHLCPYCGKIIKPSPTKPPHSENKPKQEKDDTAPLQQMQRADSARRADDVTTQSKVEPHSHVDKELTLEAPLYTQGYLKSQLDKKISIFSLLGNEIKEHSGKLVKVGANFIVLQSHDSEQVLCDLSAVKFIKIN